MRKNGCNYAGLAIEALGEEIVFGGLIQTTLLKEGPRFFLKKISPSHQSLVDHKIAQWSRSIFTAVLFALSHTRDANTSSLLRSFSIGLFLSYQRENGRNLLELSLIHGLNNAAMCKLMGGLPTPR